MRTRHRAALTAAFVTHGIALEGRDPYEVVIEHLEETDEAEAAFAHYLETNAPAHIARYSLSALGEADLDFLRMQFDIEHPEHLLRIALSETLVVAGMGLLSIKKS